MSKAVNTTLQNVAAGQGIDTIADALAYLQKSGWKVTKTSLYRHQKEGKFLPDPDGSYQQKNIDKYAKAWLKQQSTGKRVSEKMDELQRKKLERELQIQDIEYERKKLAHAKDLDKYIPKEQMEVELAGRAGILDAGLKHWVQSRCAEWIRSVDGDMKKVGELINLMNRDLDEHVNSYAAPADYDVIIDGEVEEGTETRDELIEEEAVNEIQRSTV